MVTEFEPAVDSPRLISSDATPNWQAELKAAVRSVPELLQRLGLTATDLDSPALADSEFPLRVPLSYVNRMQYGDPHDPLLLQVLPTQAEIEPQPGFEDDPVSERGQAPAPGIVHKYHGRALVIATQACAVHCRYCFRQHFPYADNRLKPAHWQAALDYLASRTELHEVVFSGGDPLSLPNDRLASLITDLEQLPHITTLRIHSRTPIVMPSRVDVEFVQLIQQTRLKTVLVVHANHARELNDEVRQALAPLRQVGTLILNQSVLLAGVNDSVDTLADLCLALFDANVQPYYLHQLDPVRGAAHFDVPDARAQQLWRELQARIPGYLVPRLVREYAGEPGKTWINQ